MILTRKIFRYNGKLYRINKNKNHQTCLDCAFGKPGLGCMFNGGCMSVETNIRGGVIIVSYDNN